MPKISDLKELTGLAQNDILHVIDVSDTQTMGVSSGTNKKVTISNLAIGLGASGALEAAIDIGTTNQYWRGDKSWQTLNKTAIGLSNVDNTSDLNKPISTATQTKLNLKANSDSPTFTGTPFTPNPDLASNNTQIATTKFVNDKIDIFANDIIDTFVDKETNQTISGIKSFDDQVVLQSNNNHLLFKQGPTGYTVLITVPSTITANRTYTIPDVGESGAFAMAVGSQTLSGQKTFNTSPIIPTTPTLDTHAASKSYVDSTRTLITGKTLHVDATAGTDTRTGLNKYDLFKPFATISAAAAASATGDLIYVRAGTYTISTQINLNLKGHLYFAPGATVNIASGIVAFSYSQNNIPIYIKGAADFVLTGGAAGVLTMPSGNAATAVAFECNTIGGPDSVSGTLFNCAVGALVVDVKVVQMTTTFTASNAVVFNITGTGIVTARIPYAYCGVFVNASGVANLGNSAIAQVNADVWTLSTFNGTAGMNLNLITTNFRIVNYTHTGVGVAFSWAENTTSEAHSFNGINWNSLAGQPHITFASTNGSTTNKRVKLYQTHIMRNASPNSLSSTVPMNVATYNTFAPVPANSNVTFKIGSFTVDTDVNIY